MRSTLPPVVAIAAVLALTSCASLMSSYTDAVMTAYDVDGPFIAKIGRASCRERVCQYV